MSGYERESDPWRNRLIVALVALLVVALTVCGGAYIVYREALVGGVADAGPLALLSTRTPTPDAPAGGEAPPAAPLPTPMPTITPTPEGAPTAVPTPGDPATSTPSATTPADLAYTVDYRGCQTPGGNSLKGQVFDSEGEIVQGATVWITLNGWPYDQPVRSNDAGWYEFYLNEGQLARIARLEVDGAEQDLVGDLDEEYPVRADCFQRVDLRALAP